MRQLGYYLQLTGEPLDRINGEKAQWVGLHRSTDGPTYWRPPRHFGMMQQGGGRFVSITASVSKAAGTQFREGVVVWKG